MKLPRILILSILLLFLINIFVLAEEQSAESASDQAPEQTTPAASSEQLPTPEEPDISTSGSEPSAALTADPGILPDSPLYVVDTLIENLLLQDDPERALEYREEKIAEAAAMAEQKKADETQEALENAAEYREVLQQEVTPEMEEETKESTEAVEETLEEISAELPELEKEIEGYIQEEKNVALAAEIAAQIKKLCEGLSQLDPLQYAQTCKTDDKAPQWRKKHHQQLTKEQEEHAQLFVEKMMQCMETPENCDCAGVGVKSFEEVCIKFSTWEAECRAGNQESCQEMMKVQFNPHDYLPDYLIEAMEEAMKTQYKSMGRNYETSYVEFGPGPCKDAGITTVEECNEYLKKNFKQDEQGRFIISGDASAPSTGPPSRLREFGRDCHALQDFTEKARCFEEFYNAVRFESEGKQEYQPVTGSSDAGWMDQYWQRYHAATTDEDRERIKAEFKEEIINRGYKVKKFILEPGQFELETEGTMTSEDTTKYDRETVQTYPAPAPMPTPAPVPPADPGTMCTMQGCSWDGTICICVPSTPVPDPATECLQQVDCTWTGTDCECIRKESSTSEQPSAENSGSSASSETSQSSGTEENGTAA